MTKVIRQKLGRENVYGFALTEEDCSKYCKKYGLKPTKNLILIDPRLTGVKELDTMIHEKLHILFEEGLQEWLVRKIASPMAKFLRDNGYKKK